MQRRFIVRKDFCSHSGWSSKYSLSSAKWVFSDVDNVICGSSAQLRQRSYAASVPSETPKPQKDRKKISKGQRQAMLESFVSRYRSVNEGKFPTASHAQKEVGGSYYVVKKILQEIECKSSVSSLKKTAQNPVGKELSEEKERPTEVDDGSNNAKPASHRGQIKSHVEDSKAVIGTSSQAKRTSYKQVESATSASHFDTAATRNNMVERETEEVSVSSVKMQGDGKEIPVKYPDFVSTESHPQKSKKKNVSHSRLEAVQDGKISENLPKFESAKHEEEPYLETDKFSDEISEKDVELPEKPSLWENLKSFAGVIIKIWGRR